MSDEVINKSLTCINNKFINKYLPVLDPVAIKVYVYALYVSQNTKENCDASDFATKLNMSDDELINVFKYLEEFELIAILSLNPLKISILDCENYSGTPKKYKAEKYSTLARTIQTIISGRMISTTEFREYFNLIEEYSFEQDALIMIINYCVNLKGNDIRLQYIKKVAKNFAEDGDISSKRVEERLSNYSNSTAALIKIFTAISIKKQPDFDDDTLYKKWTKDMGFDDDGIIAAAKCFKVKSLEKIDGVISELYKNKKFDVKEIKDYCDNKNSIYAATIEIAKALGVYIQAPAPYVENYVNKWLDSGFSLDTIKTIAHFCFLNGKNSFDLMDDFVHNLYNKGEITQEAVNDYLSTENDKVLFIKQILNICGLTRKVIDADKKFLESWKSWNFSDAMIIEACKISAGKSNPLAYVNGILSSWKKDGVFTVDQINKTNSTSNNKTTPTFDKKAEIESHYAELRRIAEEKADKIFRTALNDEIYEKLYREINSLTIKLAFVELKDETKATVLKNEISKLESEANLRLKQLRINSEDFTPKYHCTKCNDTGYDKDGKRCDCFNELLK